MKINGKFGLAVGLVLALLIGPVSSFGQGKPPVKIGFLAPFVGVWAQNGKDMEKGFRLGLEESGMKAGGRQIVMLSDDTEGQPEIGATKAHKFIEKDKVQLLAGIINSNVALAIRDLVSNTKTPLVITNAAAFDLTAKLKSPYIFRVSLSNGQLELPGGWYAATKLGMKRIFVICPDFVAGHEKADAFMKTFKAAGGQVVEEIYPPLTTNDFGPYLSKIQSKAKSADGVFVWFVGAGAIRFLQQYEEYGLKTTLPLFATGDTVDDSYMPALRDTALGIKNFLHYSGTLDTPENHKFVQAYVARFKEYPSLFSEHGYLGARVIVAALTAVKGNIEDTQAFMAAMRKVKFIGPGGPFSFDANQNAVIPVYLREVQKVDGKALNVVIGTIDPAVDQYWTPEKMTRAKK